MTVSEFLAGPRDNDVKARSTTGKLCGVAPPSVCVGLRGISRCPRVNFLEIFMVDDQKKM
jgi:hypothetical protein